MKVNGHLLYQQQDQDAEKSTISDQEDCKEQSLLFRGSVVDDDNIQQQQLLVYSMSTVLSGEDVSTIIDNIRFVDASL